MYFILLPPFDTYGILAIGNEFSSSTKPLSKHPQPITIRPFDGKQNRMKPAG
jgi:hypothetical protein